MHVVLEQGNNEIEQRFHVQFKQIKGDDESMCISHYFVQPFVSGPFKIKLGVVEQLNRTFKLYLSEVMAGYNTCN